MAENNKPILFFDGHCNLCNTTVDFLIRRDPKQKILFSSLQGETAQEKLPKHLTEQLGSLVLLEPSGERFIMSSAVFRIAWKLGGSLTLILPFWILPRFITNWGYRVIAKYRYRLFGRRETCRIPTEAEKQHFLP